LLGNVARVPQDVEPRRDFMAKRSFALVILPQVFCAAALLFVSFGARVHAQEDAELPVPAARKRDGVQITFLPPPIQGVISLGLYDGTGKLVRVLHRYATERDFVIGLNGLITRWDGKDDKGEALPAGKYTARGWTTNDLEVEGVAFHGNDWVKEDGPRFAQAMRFEKGGDGRWNVVLRDGEGKELAVPVGGAAAELSDAQKFGARVQPVLAEGEKVVKTSIGFGGNLWAIVETPKGREVRSYSQDGEFLRRLAYREDEPAPFDLAASTTAESVLLLERNDREQRFRNLGQPESTVEGSAWKTIDQKRIVASDSFASVARELGRAEPLKAEPLVKLTSKRNPLLQNARTDVEVQALVTPQGVALATADGLPLAQITEAKGLKWCALAREEKALTLFQSDGVVVEEFKIGRPDNLMSFDAGEYTLKR
jgi:hypothetical protein